MFSDEITTPCNPCYETSLPQFPTGDSITINAALAANTNHMWFIETIQGTVYQGEATSNGSGVLEIPLDEFPDGLFASGAGAFKIYIKLASEPDGDNVELTLGIGYLVDVYECIHLTFYNSPNFTNTTIE